MDFFFKNNSVENSLICPRTKSASHCLTKLFPIYQNKHWTIRRRDNHIVVQSSHRNISKIDGFFIAVCEDSKRRLLSGLLTKSINLKGSIMESKILNSYSLMILRNKLNFLRNHWRLKLQ